LKQVTGSEALELAWSAPSNLGRGAGVANNLTAYQVASPSTRGHKRRYLKRISSTTRAVIFTRIAAFGHVVRGYTRST